MIQSFQDGFDLPEGKASNTPAIPGTVMSEGQLKNQVQCRNSIYISIRSQQTTSHDVMDQTRDHEGGQRTIKICRKIIAIACNGNVSSEEVLLKYT